MQASSSRASTRPSSPLRRYAYFFVDDAVEARFQALAFQSAARVLQCLSAIFMSYIYFDDMPPLHPQGPVATMTLFATHIVAVEWLLRNHSSKTAHILHAHFSVLQHLVAASLDSMSGVDSYHSPTGKKARVAPFEMRAALYIVTVHLCAVPARHHMAHALMVAVTLMRSTTIDDLWSGSSAASRAAMFTVLRMVGREVLGASMQKMMREMFAATATLPGGDAASSSRASAGSLHADSSTTPSSFPPSPSAGRFIRWLRPPAPEPIKGAFQDGLAMLDFVNARPEPLHPVSLRFADEVVELEYVSALFRESYRRSVGTLLIGLLMWSPLFVFFRSTQLYILVGCVAIHLLPSLAVRLYVHKHLPAEDDRLACLYFGRTLTLTFVLSVSVWLVLNVRWPLLDVPTAPSSYMALMWVLQPVLVRTLHVTREHRILYILVTVSFHGICPRFTAMTRAEQVNLMWSAMLCGELFGHAYELMVRRSYFVQRKDVQLNHAVGGTVVQPQAKPGATVEVRPPSKISFDADVKPGQPKPKKDISQLNDLITESASQLALCSKARVAEEPRSASSAASDALQQRSPALALQLPTPAARTAARANDEQGGRIGPFGGPFSGPSTPSSLAPFGASSMGVVDGSSQLRRR